MVKQAIGAGTNDLSKLCTHKNINKWSIRKPAGDTTGYGFVLQPSAELEINVFDYRPPRGGAAEPYRLGDFRGYVHDAAPPELTYPKDNIIIREAKDSFDLIYFIPPHIYYRMPFIDDESLYMAVVDADIIRGPEDYRPTVYGFAPVKGSESRFQFKVEITGLNFSAGVVTKRYLIVAILKKLNLNLSGLQPGNFQLYCTIGHPLMDTDSIVISLVFEGFSPPVYVPDLIMTDSIRASFTYTSVLTVFTGDDVTPEGEHYFILDIKFEGAEPLNSLSAGAFLTLTNLNENGEPTMTFSVGQLIPRRPLDFVKQVNIPYHDFSNTFRVSLPHEPVNL